MTYGEFSDYFQHSFPSGRWLGEYEYIGGTTVKFSKLKISKDAPIIENATVVYNYSYLLYTLVVNEDTGEVHKIFPLSPHDYKIWKENNRDV
jgi:hypothetical protein